MPISQLSARPDIIISYGSSHSVHYERAKTLVQAFIHSYGPTLITATHIYNLRLQSVQNAAARLVACASGQPQSKHHTAILSSSVLSHALTIVATDQS
jgi:hypothetical protein